MSRVLLLEPFKKLPQSTDPLDIAVLEHFGRIIVEHAGFMPTGIHGPPLGLAQLAAMLHQRGHEACHEPFIIKAHRRELKDAYIEKRIRAHDFDVVGLSIGDPLSGVEARRYARIVKAINDTIPIIAGGMQPSFFPREFLQDESIDFVIRGKGEVAFPDLVDQLHEHSQLMHVQGACSKENITSDFAKEMPLASLPPVDLDAVQGKVYLKKNPFANIQTSRGCPFNCPFCLHARFWGLQPEFRPMENVRQELEYFQEHGCRLGYIIDSAFTLNRSHVDKVKTVLQELDNHIMLGFETRADAVSSSLLEGMTDVGLRLMWVGAESGSPAILRNLHGKHHDGGQKHLKDLERATVMAKDAALIIGSSWIIGLPGESPETIAETVDFMKHLISLGMDIVDPRSLALFPGTEYHDHPEKHGLHLECTAEESQHFRTGVIGCGTARMKGLEIATALRSVVQQVMDAYKHQRKHVQQPLTPAPIH